MKIVIVILGLILVGCAQPDYNEFYSNQNKTELYFIKVNDIILKTSSDAPIGAPLYQIEISSKGDFYLFDVIGNKFLVFDSTGVHKNTIGRQGKGPSEFELVYGYTLDRNDNLYVYDDALRLIKIFDAKGEISNTIKVNNNQYFVSSHTMKVADSLLYMGIVESLFTGMSSNRPSIWESSLILSSSVKKNLEELEENYIGTYDPYLQELESNYHRPLFDIDHDSRTLIATLQNSYRLQEFDLDSGERIKYFGYKNETFGERKKKISQVGNNRSQYLQSLDESSNDKVFYSTDYIITSYINGTESWFDSKDLADLKYFYAIYSRKNYDYLNVIPHNYRLVLEHDDLYYFIENEDPDNFTVGVYKLDRK